MSGLHKLLWPHEITSGSTCQVSACGPVLGKDRKLSDGKGKGGNSILKGLGLSKLGWMKGWSK